MSKLLRQRRAGVLLHPTSLPSGLLNEDVERWLDFMAETCLTVWQVLPLVIPDHTGSPYQSCSAFAANPKLLTQEDLESQVDPQVLADFYQSQQDWLPDFARFKVLRHRYPGLPWTKWPQPHRDRDPQAMDDLEHESAEVFQRFIKWQFLLNRRWQQIRSYAAERDILLFGDMPIFVALDSADVWANRHEFLLDESGRPEVVAGVPPDYFSEFGQRWGNPHYNWEAMRDNGFRWWKARLRREFEWFDIVRLDHFRGLESSWMIPADSETAVDGHWQQVPGAELLRALREAYPGLPIVAEDLGIITPEVTKLRKSFDLPGMAVLQFAFDGSEDNPHRPSNVTPDHVAYSGTHDNNTTRGWFNSLPAETRQFVYQILDAEEEIDIVELINRSLMETSANLAVLPLQDILGLGEEARMNTPGNVENNWGWRFEWQQLDDKRKAHALRELITKTGRCHAE
jgi:4-alpha-glucanotransferase